MKVICAWCNKQIGTEDGQDDMRYSVCKQCLAKFKVFPKHDSRDPLSAGNTKTE